MIEFKGGSYSSLIPYQWWKDRGGFLGQATRQNAGVKGTGRRDVYLFQDEKAVPLAQEEFKDLTNIDVFHLPMITAGTPRNSKS
ncbi:MAG: hypothetical protein ABSA13_04685 [Beijerinckiaceae bacterium]|jgi:hypothetical protein